MNNTITDEDFTHDQTVTRLYVIREKTSHLLWLSNHGEGVTTYKFATTFDDLDEANEFLSLVTRPGEWEVCFLETVVTVRPVVPRKAEGFEYVTPAKRYAVYDKEDGERHSAVFDTENEALACLEEEWGYSETIRDRMTVREVDSFALNKMT